MSYYASIVDIIDYLHESVFPLVSGLPQVDEDDNSVPYPTHDNNPEPTATR